MTFLQNYRADLPPSSFLPCMCRFCAIEETLSHHSNLVEELPMGPVNLVGELPMGTLCVAAADSIIESDVKDFLEGFKRN